MPQNNNVFNKATEAAPFIKNTFAEHGNEIEEIISIQPPMIVRWGTLLLFFFLLFIGIISWFIKYPDIITAPAKLTSINSPKPVITLINGKLIKLSIAENQSVNKNQIVEWNQYLLKA